jgi:hypothetical protein
VRGSFELAGFCWAGLLCLVLAVLKLTVEGHWSWWRVLLPFWVVLGHNILYVAIGLVWLSFRDDGVGEEAVTIRKGRGGYSYQVVALVCFVVFADNVLRRIEGQQGTILWVSSGRWEPIVVFGMLSVILQVLFGLTLWIPVIAEPAEGNGSGIGSIFQRAGRVFDEFLDPTPVRRLTRSLEHNGDYTATGIENRKVSSPGNCVDSRWRTV